jgi:hypothetical protein
VCCWQTVTTASRTACVVSSERCSHDGGGGGYLAHARQPPQNKHCRHRSLPSKAASRVLHGTVTELTDFFFARRGADHPRPPLGLGW